VESGTRETEFGDTWIEKGATAVTASEKVAVCVIEPLVPVTVMALLPTGAASDADKTNGEPCIVPMVGSGAMLAGIVATPVGSPVTVRLIVPLNPFKGFAEIF
jgi:hypothetical protein